MSNKHETETGAEFINPTHLRHVMRYVKAAYVILNDAKISDNNITNLSILDAACGTGYGSNVIFNVVKSLKQPNILGIDFCDEALEFARDNYSDECIRFEKHDILRRLECSEQFDVVISIETIEHFSRIDIEHYLDTLLGVLKHDGLFIVSTPYCEQSGPSPIVKQHLYEFNIDEFCSLLTNRGLNILRIDLDHKPGKAGRLGYAMAVCRKIKEVS
jgi:2-polyprenyl-3-methyl-5-hydroxy-6-metoxy-1,4-benzoquinol methylase